jgi:ABC-2 type transport system permease protein
MGERLGAILDHRKTIQLLIIRDLKVKYADSYLGWLWSVLDPLLMSIIYWFVFTKIFPRPNKTDPYILFLLLGVLPWHWASSVINSATGAISSQSRLVRSTRIPREVWVLRVVGSKYLEFLLSIPVVIVVMILLRVRPDPYAFTIPLAMILQAIFLTGLAFCLAPVSMMVPDLDRLMRIFTRILFYLSPVLYGMANVQERLSKGAEWVKAIYYVNPLAGQLDLYRASAFPEQFTGWGLVASSAFFSVMWLVVGAFVFTRLEKPMLKEL